MTRHRVCQAEEVAIGALMPVTVGRSNIVLTKLPSGEIKAVTARCPHQGAKLEHGCMTGHVYSDHPNELHVDQPGQILRCPWHGFEFDVCSGRPLVGGTRMRLQRYAVEIEGDEVFVVL